MSSLDPSSPAFTSLAGRRSAPERILSIEGGPSRPWTRIEPSGTRDPAAVVRHLVWPSG